MVIAYEGAKSRVGSTVPGKLTFRPVMTAFFFYRSSVRSARTWARVGSPQVCHRGPVGAATANFLREAVEARGPSSVLLQSDFASAGE